MWLIHIDGPLLQITDSGSRHAIIEPIIEIHLLRNSNTLVAVFQLPLSANGGTVTDHRIGFQQKM
jgi:hypothetical protein